MAHRLLRDTEADGWERSDFPIICETCLGANPYVRMTKANFDKECKICTRPFTVFRWRPGRDARYKKTEICQTCCKLKNVCQVCLLDLEYGLPVQVRDSALGIDTTDAIPKSDVNKEYFAEEHDRKARAGLDYESSYGKARPTDTILKLQRTTPYYKRNRAHICSFFVRGDCTRGAECPYRHEMPVTGELAEQNIKDRFYGVNDPVARKMLRRAAEMPSLEPPDDKSIRTLYIGGLDSRVSDKDLKDQFYGYGELESIRVVANRSCAFVTYTTREGAEKAAENMANKLVVKGLRLRLLWGKPAASKEGEDAEGAAVSPFPPEEVAAAGGSSPALGASGASASAAASGLVPRALQQAHLGPSAAVYPSMDPERLGAPVAHPQTNEAGTEGRGGPEYTPPAPAGAYPAAMPPPPHGVAGPVYSGATPGSFGGMVPRQVYEQPAPPGVYEGGAPLPPPLPPGPRPFQGAPAYTPSPMQHRPMYPSPHFAAAQTPPYPQPYGPPPPLSAPGAYGSAYAQPPPPGVFPGAHHGVPPRNRVPPFPSMP